MQELAEPTIKDAFGKCVQQGASRVIVSPYFLSPGRHWKQVCFFYLCMIVNVYRFPWKIMLIVKAVNLLKA